jgi:hypothetical protein
MEESLGERRRLIYGISHAREIHRMRTQVPLQPGQSGTKRLLVKYVKQLVWVRYRHDATRQYKLGLHDVSQHRACGQVREGERIWSR